MEDQHLKGRNARRKELKLAMIESWMIFDLMDQCLMKETFVGNSKCQKNWFLQLVNDVTTHNSNLV